MYRTFIPGILVLIGLFISIAGFSQVPAWEWSKRIGGANEDEPLSITTDGQGNIYTVGIFSGLVDFDPGPGIATLLSAGATDVYISKLDISGNYVWAKRVGGSTADFASVIALDDSGNIYIKGLFSGTADFDPSGAFYNVTAISAYCTFIAKMDSACNLLWVDQFDASFNGGSNRSMIVHPNGSIYLTGEFTGSVDFDPGTGVVILNSAGTADDIFFAKYSNLGSLEWVKQLGSTSEESGVAIAPNASFNGAVFLAGDFFNTLDLNPFASTFNVTSAGQTDIFISSYNNLGVFIWGKRIGGTNYDVVTSMVVDSVSNAIYLTGYFSGTCDFNPDATVTYNLTAAGSADIFVLKLDNLGNFLWAKRIGGTDTEHGYAISVNDVGNVVVTGDFKGTVDLDPSAGILNVTSNGVYDLFISEFDSQGNFIWAKTGGGINDDCVRTVDCDQSGNIYVGGYFESPSLFLAPLSLVNAGGTSGGKDVFISKINGTTTSILTLDNLSSMVIYPNPASNQITVNLPKTNHSQFTVTLTDLAGKEIYREIVEDKNELTLSVNDFSDGVYMLKLEGVDYVEFKRLVVMK